MALGDGFNATQRQQIDKAIRDAETSCRLEFSVFVGTLQQPARETAVRLHSALVAPDLSVLIAVDPQGRQLEVVTGPLARRQLDDQAVALAVADMQSLFALDNLVGGLIRGINALASSARRPRTLHA